MEDNQQRLPFFLRIHAHSGKYHVKKSISEIFCQMASVKHPFSNENLKKKLC